MFLHGILYYHLLDALEDESVNIAFENVIKMHNPPKGDSVIIKHIESNVNNFGIGGERAKEVAYFEIRVLSDNLISLARYYKKIVDKLKSNTTVISNPTTPIEVVSYELNPLTFGLAEFSPNEDVSLNVGDYVSLREGIGHVLKQIDSFTYLVLFGEFAQYYTEVVRASDTTTPKRGVYEIRIFAKVNAIY